MQVEVLSGFLSNPRSEVLVPSYETHPTLHGMPQYPLTTALMRHTMTLIDSALINEKDIYYAHILSFYLSNVYYQFVVFFAQVV